MIKTKAVQETERTFKFISVDVDGEEVEVSPSFEYSEKHEEWLLDSREKYAVAELEEILKVMKDLNKEKRKLIKVGKGDGNGF